jgi:hypothetical protein
MMYIKLNNGEVETYPYSYGQLKTDNPQTSFPADMSDERLAEWNVIPVKPKDYPQVDHTKNVTEGTPVRQKARNPDGTFVADNPETPVNEAWEWVQVWNVTDASADEIVQRTEQQANDVRQARNDTLSACDWTQLADAVVDKEAWAAYRQALRDIPQQEGFPWDVIFPEKP